MVYVVSTSLPMDSAESRGLQLTAREMGLIKCPETMNTFVGEHCNLLTSLTMPNENENPTQTKTQTKKKHIVWG